MERTHAHPQSRLLGRLQVLHTRRTPILTPAFIGIQHFREKKRERERECVCVCVGRNALLLLCVSLVLCVRNYIIPVLCVSG